MAKVADGMPLLTMPGPFKAIREAACNAITRRSKLWCEVLVVFSVALCLVSRPRSRLNFGTRGNHEA